MVKNVYAVGFMLFIATMLLFFGMYFFGMNVDFFNNSMLLNAFLLPVVYVAGAYYSVTSAKKFGFPMDFGQFLEALSNRCLSEDCFRCSQSSLF